MTNPKFKVGEKVVDVFNKTPYDDSTHFIVKSVQRRQNEWYYVCEAPCGLVGMYEKDLKDVYLAVIHAQQRRWGLSGMSNATWGQRENV